MREPIFKAGEVVQLKSDGPAMTVELIIKSARQGIPEGIFNGDYKCTWFNGPTLNTKEFAEEVLKKHAGRIGIIGSI